MELISTTAESWVELFCFELFCHKTVKLYSFKESTRNKNHRNPK